MMLVKADLAICSSAIGVSGQCKSVAFKSSHYLDFSSCRIVPGLFWIFANQVTYGWLTCIILIEDQMIMSSSGPLHSKFHKIAWLAIYTLFGHNSPPIWPTKFGFLILHSAFQTIQV